MSLNRRDFVVTGAAISLVAIGPRGAGAEDVVITIKGARFSPDRLTVRKGQPITIVDRDNTSHSIYSESPGMEFQLAMRPSTTGTFKLTAAGTATLECAEHPTEIAKITVVA
jgi:plastocyanin